MTDQCLEECLAHLEARFLMTGRYWSPAVVRVYTLVLQPYDDGRAWRILCTALDGKNDPPTDRELSAMLRQESVISPSRPADTDAVCAGRTGKILFERAFRGRFEQMRAEKGERFAAGEKIFGFDPALTMEQAWPEWARRFRRWANIDATNAEIGREIAVWHPGMPDPFADEDDEPQERLPYKETD